MLRKNTLKMTLRLSLIMTVVVFVAVSAFGLVSTRTVAQEATPTAAGPNLTIGQLAPLGESFEVIPGVDIELLNEGETDAAPGQSLVLYRVTFRGGEVPSHTHPGATVLVVESGTFAWTLQQGTVRVTRPGQDPEEVTEPGTELVLNPGEGLSYNAEVVHTARAAGDEETSVLVSSLFETGQPLVTITDEQGTPTS